MTSWVAYWGATNRQFPRSGTLRATSSTWFRTPGGRTTRTGSGSTPLEARADEIKTYEALLIPGLLQTPEHARAVFQSADAEDVEELVEARTRRQDILSRDRPPRLWVLIDESAIDRPTN
ncbi:MAG: Scr1 family TA system antitoxin-like transcriptional regulator, partial [Actinoallomurus sp.]